ncbi:T9SS type A sorting domain-containing protein [Bacteroidota bacterium]
MSLSIKNIVYLILILSLISISLLSQTKRVLLEQHTGAWCGWCVDGTVVMDDIIEDYPDQVIGVKLHNGDAMAISEQSSLASQLGLEIYPSGTIDRKEFSGKIFQSRSNWRTHCVTSMGQTPKVDVLLEYKIDTQTKKLYATVTCSTLTTVNEQMRFNIIICEDSVSGSGSGYNQRNYISNRSGYESHPYYPLPDPIEGYQHMKVVRDMVGGAWGSGVMPKPANSGQTYKYSTIFDLNENWEIDQLFFVGLVQTFEADNKEILNCIYGDEWETLVITGTISDLSFCAGSQIDIPYLALGSFNGGNMFIAQLSDAEGHFDNPLNLDTLTSTESDTLKNVLIPDTLSEGSSYRIRVVGTNPSSAEVDNNENITIYAIPELSIIEPTDTVCAESNQKYITSSSEGINIRWEVTGGVIEGSDDTDTVSVFWGSESSGIIKLIKTNQFTECNDSTELSIVINSLPLPEIIDPVDSVCAESIKTYKSNSSEETGNLWQVTGGVIQGDNDSDTINVLWRSGPNGEVKLKQTNLVTDCYDSTVVYVLIYPVPNPEIINPKDTVCMDSYQIYTTNTPEGVQNIWKVSGGIIDGNNDSDTVLIIWGNETAGELKLIQTNLAGDCSDSILVSITILPLPIVTISGDSIACQNEVIIYSTTDSEGMECKWRVYGGTILGSNNLSEVDVQWDTVGSSTVTLEKTIVGTGCENSESQVITVHSKPIAEIFGNNQVCERCKEMYYTNHAENISNVWDVAQGTIIGSSEGDSVEIEWGMSGNGYVSLIQLNTESGCSDTAHLDIFVNEYLKPQISGDTIVCENDIKTYIISTNPDFDKQWYVTSGTVIGSSTMSNVDVLWGDVGPGSIKIILSNEEKEYKDSTEREIIIMELPIVVFESEINQVCLSDSILPLNGGMPMGGIYSGNGVVEQGLFDVELAGIWEHSITYTFEDNGCSNSVVDTIVVFPLPDKPIITENNKKLLSSEAEQYQWYFNGFPIPNADKREYNPGWDEGEYQVEITDENGCKNMSDPYHYDPTGIEGNMVKKRLTVIPNPFTGTTTISYAINSPGEVHIAISDLMGKEVAKPAEDAFMEAGQHSIEFDASELPAGIYFCTLRAGGYTETVKMVVVR